MRFKIAKYKSIAVSIGFLLNALILLSLIELPWRCYYLVIIVSCCYAAIGGFGLYSLCREKWSLTLHYTNILKLVVILKALGALALIAVIANSSIFVQNFLRNLISHYYKNAWAKEQMDHLQKTGHCCGIVGYKNWENTQIPDSCCKNNSTALTHQNDTTGVCDYYENGCQFEYEETFILLGIILELVLIIKIILNICAIFDGIYLVRKFRELSNKHMIMETVEYPKDVFQ